MNNWVKKPKEMRTVLKNINKTKQQQQQNRNEKRRAKGHYQK